ncbi:beta-1,2-xylosyltransferase RCN11-like [Phragmites australis]|uniref:beta-1,2-xylosyltransferase RCN11-like n=1 Tax=Phragmites australis TaxID=29695 RepID=UPI002D785FAF|nr:beta-1,2-xylosyltransferase RCN11-like [Phragmites australis]
MRSASARSATILSLCKGGKRGRRGQSELHITAVRSTPTPHRNRPIRPHTHSGLHFPRALSGDRHARGSRAMMAGRAHNHSNRLRRLIPRALFLVFAVHAVSFALYLLLQSHHPSPNPTQRTPVRDEARVPSSQKPWPHLPSFLPWVPGPTPPPHSCEAYFGNGFSRRVDVLPAGGGGWFRCHHSETLSSSICEGARVRLDPALITMSRGGELLEQVMGRAEEEELPKYEPGALQVEGAAAGRTTPLVDAGFLDAYVNTGGIAMHTMRALLESARVVPPGELHCSQWVEEPTLLVTRFEYANLFHTITDWYSAYVSSRVTNLPSRPNVLFVDGHCKAQLEQTWESLFSSVTYAKNFSGPVCFRHAILSPLGYETALFKGLSESFSCEGASAQSLREKPDYGKTSRLSEFGEMIVASFDLLQDDIMSTKKLNGLNVLFVRREDYLAHPRHSGKVESRLSNEPEVYDAIDKWAKGQKCKINVVNGLFAHMTMKEQLRAILEASVVIGAHGAGLTHLVSATPDTKVLEIISSMYRRPHFALISHWKALEYHAINLPGSYARITDVISELSNILKGLGC